MSKKLRSGKATPTSRSSKTKEPFQGVETIAQAKIVDAVRECLAKAGFESLDAPKAVVEAITDIRNGASKKAAIKKHPIDWPKLFKALPGLESIMDAAVSYARVSGEIATLARNPERWLAQMFKEDWTPNQNNEISGGMTINVQFGDDQPPEPAQRTKAS